MVWSHHQWGEYKWRREGNWKLSPGTCQHSETGGKVGYREATVVRGEPKSALDPGSESRKCFKRERVTPRYQGSGLRPGPLSLQSSHSARRNHMRRDSLESKIWVMLEPCWAIDIFGMSTADRQTLEFKRWIQLWDVDLEVFSIEMTFKAITRHHSG